MTSPLPHYQTVQLVRSDDSCGTDANLKLQPARRYDDGYEEGAPSAPAALFAGLFIGSGSTALMIWLATLVL